MQLVRPLAASNYKYSFYAAAVLLWRNTDTAWFFAQPAATGIPLRLFLRQGPFNQSILLTVAENRTGSK